MTDQPKRKAGRPQSGPEKLQRVAVTLDKATIKRGREIGNGSLSQGIRIALAQKPKV